AFLGRRWSTALLDHSRGSLPAVPSGTGEARLRRSHERPILLAPSPGCTTGRSAEGGGRVSDTKHDRLVRVPTAGGGGGLDRFFKISERGSNVRTEVVAGITTWLTMAYILFLNPQILGA